MHLSREAIGTRLQKERKRLGLNQEEFAARTGVAKRTLAGYESGSSDVGASVLGLASELGVDVLYVVTGDRTPELPKDVTSEEARILDHYRTLPELDRAAVERLTSAMAETVGLYEIEKKE